METKEVQERPHDFGKLKDLAGTPVKTVPLGSCGREMFTVHVTRREYEFIGQLIAAKHNRPDIAELPLPDPDTLVIQAARLTWAPSDGKEVAS